MHLLLLSWACTSGGTRPVAPSDESDQTDQTDETDTTDDPTAPTGDTAETSITDTATTPTSPTTPVWWTVSGGGYHSHSAMAGWTMGMLEASGLGLGDLTQNVAGIACNSGGCWFTTQLAYSAPFRTALETEPDAWSDSGYLGQTNEIYSHRVAPCAGWLGNLQLLCTAIEPLQDVFMVMQLPGVGELDWQLFVEQVVYAPFAMAADLGSVPLEDGPREAWAVGKTLILASSLMTDDVVLTQEVGFPFDKDLYSAVPTVGVRAGVNFTPAFFSSAGADGVVPDFLSEGSQDLTYTTNHFPRAPRVEGAFVAVQGMEMSVLDAAAACSAATAPMAGLLALDESGIDDDVPLTDEEMSFLFRDLAPAIRVGPGGVERVDPVVAGIEASAASSTVRMADGGYSDDTAIAFMLRHLADRGTPDDFVVMSFVNGTSAVELGDLPPEVLRLFGNDGPAGTTISNCAEGYCVRMASPQVFEAAGLDAAAPVWTWTDREVELSHFVLPVVTVDNPTFGVERGHTGTLHVFQSVHEGSDQVPLDDATLATYADVVAVTRDAVLHHGGWGELAPLLQVP